jgi:hypothetical protein
MVKAYLRYDFASSYGVVTSAANPEFDASGKRLISSSLENLSIWNIKQGELVRHSCERGRGQGAAPAPQPPLCMETALNIPCAPPPPSADLDPAAFPGEHVDWLSRRGHHHR